MASDSNENRELADVEQVKAAIEAIVAGRLDDADSLLLAVIANTPPKYSNSEDHGDTMSIKFWDLPAFVHYVTWHRDRGLLDKGINWIGNAYPRAHYHMGFLCVKRKQFDRAIEFLDKGQCLEPTNPRFVLEKAQALVLAGRKQESLALYDQIAEIGPHVSPHALAVARRGRGFVLIEMNDLKNAEAAFQASLEIEPNNEVALNELRYIKHLRQGGGATFTEVVASTGSDLSRCAVCGKQLNKGVFRSLDGMLVSICQRCEGKRTKQWWQFWK